MAAIKADVEPCDEGVNEIVTGGTEFKVGDEGEVGDGAGGKVDVEDSVRVCDDGFEVDGVDERFAHCDSSDGGKVEAVDGFPETYFFFLVVCVLDAGDVQ
jgi:hypothetical protein